jgi:hypothetical protein
VRRKLLLRKVEDRLAQLDVLFGQPVRLQPSQKFLLVGQGLMLCDHHYGQLRSLFGKK